MSDTSPVYCGPCQYNGRTEKAKKWCTNCEEGICANCAEMHKATKVTRNHHLIAIEDYQKISNLNISQTCEAHGKTLDLYCKTHDCVLCLACAQSEHKTCSDIVPLEDVATNAKSSTALADVEESINGLLKNIKTLIHEQDIKSKDLEKQEKETKSKIAEIRRKINAHLDKIEHSLLIEVNKAFGDCKSECENLMKNFKTTERSIMHFREKTSKMKKYASDIQVFLGTRQTSKVIMETIHPTTSRCKVKDFSLNLQINPFIDSFLTEVKRFGTMNVEVTEKELHLYPAKTEQAQIHVQAPATTDVSKVQVSLKRNFNIKQKGIDMDITGCAILPDGKMLIADFSGKKQLIQYNQDGQHVRYIPTSGIPHDITVIDSDRVAVSYGFFKYIEILDIKKRKVKKKVNLDNWCYGLSYQDGKLYVVVEYCGIVIVKLSGTIVNTLPLHVSRALYVSKGNIYYSDYQKAAVICCDMAGKQIWEFGDLPLVWPLGLAVDSNGNVFVAGGDSNNVTIISSDGKTSKTLLTADNGLNYPSAINYSKDLKLLLVCNGRDGKAALFRSI